MRQRVRWSRRLQQARGISDPSVKADYPTAERRNLLNSTSKRGILHFEAL
jgi:hypothetical protein